MSCPDGWVNFDASPRLWLQRLPVLGRMFRRGQVVFPRNVHYGDIVKGLPAAAGSAAGVYASHVLEHLALEDFRTALRNTSAMLKSGGVFRLVVPDLEQLARYYLARVERGDPESCNWFMRTLQLGSERSRRSMQSRLAVAFGNGAHLWMWDYCTLATELERAGFADIRRCAFGDCVDKTFRLVEEEARFNGSCAIEARNP
jgi:predicted SAM-dependent methyltransferase